MQPNARVSAAIEILDTVLAGEPAEKALTTWARRSRFAGSGDRAAIRDLVFNALRCKRSFSWLGGAETGRGLMIGALRAQAHDPSQVFTGEGHAPLPLTGDETDHPPLAEAPEAVQLDLPDWLLPHMQNSLGETLHAVAALMQNRAPVFLRVNTAKTDRAGAINQLKRDEIGAIPHDLSETALEVVENPRRIANSTAYQQGLVELQDVASQAVVDLLPTARKVLDYCAGGGGKSLALAARQAHVFAHDANFARMRDIPARAARAGAPIQCIETAALADHSPYDLVLCDVPCSGSGAWRRSPDAKWRFSPEMLGDLLKTQNDILNKASALVAPNGALAYVTCSLLDLENAHQIDRFCTDNPQWKLQFSKRFTPLDGGDGFFVAVLQRS